MDKIRADRILDIQQSLISMIALGRPVEACLLRVATEIEMLFEEQDCYCSILSLDGETLKHCVAPSLRPGYCEAIDGLEIGPSVGSCGTAAYTQKTVVVSEIASDPLWEGYQELAENYGLRSCWSVPIISSDKRVLGTFAVYFGHVRSPSYEELRLIKRFRSLAGIVFERDQNESKARELNKALQYNSHRFESFAQAMPDLVIVFDEDGKYVDIYGTEVHSLILPVSVIKGRGLKDILPPAKSARMISVIKRCIEEDKKQTFEYELDVNTGTRIFEARVSPIHSYSPEEPNLKHVVWVAQDITERKKADDTIRKLSFYDSVTSLPNRRLLKERIDLHLRKARERKLHGAILYIDIVDFKRVNEALGVSGGDALIVEAAQRIADQIEHRDSLARVGGDDFVVLLDQMSGDIDVFSNRLTDIATRVQSVFDTYFNVADKKLRVQARIGISIFGTESVASEKLISQAESAMYRAKESQESVVFFDGKIQKMQSERIHMEYELEQAIRNQEITVFYQPQVDQSGTLRGMEALMRWENSSLGFVSPLKFIPLAEQLGIIAELQEVVLRNACGVIKVLEQSVLLPKEFRVAINVSATLFAKDDFERSMTEVLNQYATSAKRITLEITESALLEDLDSAYAKMQRLRVIGFDLSIDDFGTGYSSLAYLQKLPADELKVDKSFIDGILESEAGRNIVSAIVYLARQLNCRVVVEGVEEEAQVNFLKTQDIDLLQGYYFAKPMDVETLLEWVSKNSSLPALSAQRA